MSEKPKLSDAHQTEHTPAVEGEVELDPADAHIGATEEQVSDTPAPAGDGFNDEPKQG